MSIPPYRYNPRHYLLPVVLFFLLAISTWLPQFLTLEPGTSYGDEGALAQHAKRVVNGQWPFRDFFCGAPPGAAYWFGLFLLLFGEGFFALRIGVLVTAFLILLLALWIVSRLSPQNVLPALFLISFLAFFGGPYWFIASIHWVSLLFSLLSFALLLSEPGTTKPAFARVFLSGVAGAAAAFTLQHKGALWLLAATAAMFSTPREFWRSYLCLFWLGVLAVCVPFFAIFLVKVGWQPLFDQMVRFPITRYHLLEAHRGTTVLNDLWASWQNVGFSWPSATDNFSSWLTVLTWNLGFLGRIILHLLPFAGLAGGVWLWRCQALPRFHLALLTAFFFASYLATLHRFHETTLCFAASAAIFVLAVVFRESRTRNLFFLGSVLPSVLVVFFMCIALGFMRIHSLPSKTATTLPAGTINSIYASEAAELAGLEAFLRQHRQPEEAVVCLTYLPMLYFLFDLDNPTPFEILTYPLNSEQQLAEVESLLGKKKIRWIIKDRGSLGTTSLAGYLGGQYRLKVGFKNFAVFERIDSTILTNR